MPTDVIFQNAGIITMDPACPRAELAAVSDDSFFYVGANSEAARLTGRSTKIIDCGGKTLVPGFNDAHLHLFSLFKKLLSIDLSPGSVRSIGDIKEALRRKARFAPPGAWISGTDYNEFYLEGGRCPTRADLDDAAPDHPVIISHRSLHACVLNSKALELAGISRDTPEPDGGRIERDLATGEPNGVLIDMQGYVRNKIVSPITPQELAWAAEEANKQFLACGITSFTDATVSNDLKRWETVCDLVLNRKLKSRVTMMAGALYRREFEQRGMKTGAGDNLMQLGAAKIVPEVAPDQAALNSLVLACHRGGWQTAVHAVAESTVEAAVIALENAAKDVPAAGRRHRIEHCGECPPALLERIRKLGAVIVTQPPFIYYNGERYLATVPPGQLPWLYRIKAPLEKGIVVAGSSDAPVVPFSPLAGIGAAVTRLAASGQAFLQEEKVTPEQALALYTSGAAYAAFDEKTRGRIAPGCLADLALLSADPTRVPPEEIKDIKVEMTVIGGKVVWEK